jgi:thioredoxin-dependent peroxiredoxin
MQIRPCQRTGALADRAALSGPGPWYEGGRVLEIGDKAPPFDVQTSEGKRVSLAEFHGKKNVVLFFYPKDFTRVCTAEVCGFRDMYEELVGRDTEVIGVSLDSDESHQRFAQKHRVPYPLVADTDKSLGRAYGAVGTLRGLLGLAKRMTYVIDKQGTIVAIFQADFDADTHLSGVKGALAKLGG